MESVHEYEGVHEYEDVSHVGRCTDSEKGNRSHDESHIKIMLSNKGEDIGGYLIPNICANCEKPGYDIISSKK